MKAPNFHRSGMLQQRQGNQMAEQFASVSLSNTMPEKQTAPCKQNANRVSAPLPRTLIVV
jgi:hypothetical protein